SAALYTVTSTSSSATASGTITDNDTPILSLTAAGTATEGDDIQLTVTSDIAIAATAPDIGFTLTFAARSGSGITGADFTNGLTHALTKIAFTGGSNTIATVPIATVDDTAYEGNEDYAITLSATTGATLGSDFSEDGTLADNDAPALSLTAASAAAEGEIIQLTVTSNIAIAATAPDIGFTLTFAARSGSGITGADFGGNYADLTQALTGVAFTGGSGTTATVPVATVNDALYEGDEDYTATLSTPTGATLDTDDSEDGTLADNDAPALSLEDASNAAEGSPVSLIIKSSSAFAAQTVWNVVIAFSGTGIEAADFGDNVLSRTVSVTFAEGEDTATVPMATQNDTVYEGDEVYTATLSAASAALYTVTSSSSATASGTITDNDTPALSLTAAGTATEGDDIQLTVTSDIAIAATAPDIGFTLTFAARSGSGITGADFTNGLMHALTEVKFTGGSGTTATVPIATVDDTAYEGNEDYTATLSAASAALYTVTSSNATASGTITDNDIPALSLTAASAAAEGEIIELTVTSDIAIAATAPDIGFTLTFAPRSGSGITGADFTNGLTQALTGVAFTSGSGTTATVLVATVDDTLYEGDEDYTATLSAPTGATLDTDDSEDGTLTDN
ncbi:MAG: Calx-beta domain-containing protein, partial [Candidatus Eutrophobiaceae bacterium]